MEQSREERTVFGGLSSEPEAARHLERAVRYVRSEQLRLRRRQVDGEHEKRERLRTRHLQRRRCARTEPRE